MLLANCGRSAFYFTNVAESITCINIGEKASIIMVQNSFEKFNEKKPHNLVKVSRTNGEKEVIKYSE